MCGIAGIHVKPGAKGILPVGRLLDAMLLGIEARGRDATGYLSVSFDHEIQIDKAEMAAKDFVEVRKTLKGATQTIIGHTRLATQGSPGNNENNHPVQHATVFTTHNGVIWNDYELFKSYSMERAAEVDSAILSAMLAEFGFERAEDAMAEIEGSFAFASVDVREPGEVLVVRGYQSPLVLLENKDIIMWASTQGAIEMAWKACLGTPPNKKKYEYIKEGTILRIVDGKITRSSFDVKEARKFYTLPSMYGWDDDDWTDYRSYGYTGGSIKPAPALDGPMNRPVVYSARKPHVGEMNTVATFVAWGEYEAECMDYALELVGEELNLSKGMVQWVLFMADDKIIEASPSLDTLRKYADNLYKEILGGQLNEHTVSESKELVVV